MTIPRKKNQLWQILLFASLVISFSFISFCGNEDKGNSGKRSAAEMFCGNGLKEGSEECDGNNFGIEGETASCNTNCKMARCGDGVLNISAGEQCDAGPDGSATCDTRCRIIRCGNGYVQAGEECDGDGDGTGGLTGACNTDCSLNTCGDNKLNRLAGEQCEAPQASLPSTVCSAGCQLLLPGDPGQCGNGTVDGGEQCDPGAAGETAVCNRNCTNRSCGDGILNVAAGEQCDGDNNGNGGATAFCSATCTLLFCGDGVVTKTAGEWCDYGAANGGVKGCSATCTRPGKDIYEASVPTGDGDDVYTGARTIPIDGTVISGHSIDYDGDVDWFKFTTTAVNTTLKIEIVDAPCEDGDSKSLQLGLVAANGSTNLLANVREAGGGLGKSCPVATYTYATAGTYYLRVNNQFNGSNGVFSAYSLRLTPITADINEPNETSGAATVISTIPTNLSGLTLVQNDSDWFRVTSPADNSTLYVALSGTCKANDFRTLVLEIYDSNGTTMLSPSVSEVGIAQLDVQCPFASVTLPVENNQYFVKVYAKGNSNLQSNANAVFSEYSISFAFVAPDSLEPNNVKENAVSLSIGSPAQTANLHTAADIDWYSVNISDTGRMYKIQPQSSECAGMDGRSLRLNLLDTDGITILASAQDAAIWENIACPVIYYQFETPGVYYITLDAVAYTAIPLTFETGGAVASQNTGSSTTIFREYNMLVEIFADISDRYEANNSVLNATVIQANQGLINANLHLMGDIDNYRFNVTDTSATFFIGLKNADCSPGDNRAFQLRILDTDGETVLNTVKETSTGSGNYKLDRKCPSVMRQFPQPGFYYIEIAADEAGINYKPMGSYSLLVSRW